MDSNELEWQHFRIMGELEAMDQIALSEYDTSQEKVSNGELCSVDFEPCDWDAVSEEYGADRDGNRGIWLTFKRCRKCGEER